MPSSTSVVVAIAVMAIQDTERSITNERYNSNNMLLVPFKYLRSSVNTIDRIEKNGVHLLLALVGWGCGRSERRPLCAWPRHAPMGGVVAACPGHSSRSSHPPTGALFPLRHCRRTPPPRHSLRGKVGLWTDHRRRRRILPALRCPPGCLPAPLRHPLRRRPWSAASSAASSTACAP